MLAVQGCEIRSSYCGGMSGVGPLQSCRKPALHPSMVQGPVKQLNTTVHAVIALQELEQGTQMAKRTPRQICQLAFANLQLFSRFAAPLARVASIHTWFTGKGSCTDLPLGIAVLVACAAWSCWLCHAVRAEPEAMGLSLSGW